MKTHEAHAKRVAAAFAANVSASFPARPEPHCYYGMDEEGGEFWMGFCKNGMHWESYLPTGELVTISATNAVSAGGIDMGKFHSHRDAIRAIKRRAHELWKTLHAPTDQDGTWTFMGHWNDADELELDYYVPGEVEDMRVDVGRYEGGLFADSASGTSPEAAWAALRKEYESDGDDDDTEGTGQGGALIAVMMRLVSAVCDRS